MTQRVRLRRRLNPSRPRPRPRRSVNSLPRWMVVYTVQSPDTTEQHSSYFQNDSLHLVIKGKSAQDAIERAEARFEQLLGSESRPGWTLHSVNQE